MKITLLLVDDHAVFRESLRRTLQAEPDMEVIGQANDATTGVAMWTRLRPDVTVMDLMMHGSDGIEAVRQIREQAPGARILLLTSSEEHQDAIHALSAGAAGYVTKASPLDELLAAIRSVHAGGRPVSAALARRIESAGQDGLCSERELELLGLLRDGLSYREIGRLLGVTERTTRAYVATLKEKLGTATLAQTVARAFERGILRRPPGAGPWGG